MIVKTLVLDLYIQNSNSLKDKRRVLKSLKQKCRQKFNISISELDEFDNFRRSILGIAVISTNDNFADQVLDKTLNLIETEYNSIEILDLQKERN